VQVLALVQVQVMDLPMVMVTVRDQVTAPAKVMALVMVPELEMHPRTVPVSVLEIVQLNP